MIIRELTNTELNNGARVIRDSFKTVAAELGLNRDNTPTHPSFMTEKRLRDMAGKGMKLFGLFLDESLAGTVAIEKADDNTCYMERLAVLPGQRHKGYGEKLVEFTFEYVKKNGGRTVSIAIIDEQTALKNWYIGLGFRETGTKEFPHLPFTVCFMEKDLKSG